MYLAIEDKVTNFFYYAHVFFSSIYVLIFFLVIHYTCSLSLVVVDLTLPDEQILNENQPDMDDFISPENQDEEAIAMGEESSSSGI